MKKLISLLIILMVIFSFGLATAQDGPYLVCDPMEVDHVTHYEIELNDSIIEVQPTEVNATHIKIHYSISELEPGNYTARARSANSEWNKVSEWTDSISWTVPSNQDMPTCINFRKE